MALLLYVSFPSAADNTTEPSITVKAKSILQRIAEQCRKDNSCPDYVISKKTQPGEVKITKPSLNSTGADTNKKNSIPSPSTIKTLSLTEFDQVGLITEFMVKESAGKGTNNFPITTVFPLAYGQYQTTDDFYVLDSHKMIIPAQVEVLNRWWGKDNSIRHILVHFNTSVGPFDPKVPNTGITQYALYFGKKHTSTQNPIRVKSTQKIIELSNNLFNITINKKPLTISTPAGQLQSIFQNENGISDYSFNHKDIKFEIEENGPLRSVIKISSLTTYYNPKKIKHGWALRLYAYANSPLLKLDFQLQNSAINVPISAPLYFKSHTLRIENAQVSANQSIRADEIPLANIENLPLGIIHADNVNVMLRHFWQTFPNGLSTHTDGNVDIELWPDWSKQFYNDHFVGPETYWLDDMKQTYKEVLLDFSGQSDTDYLQKIAKTFQYPPVVVIPQEYYAKTKVTVDYGGIFPKSAVPISEARIPSYKKEYYDADSYGGYRFGMDNFGLDTARKIQTNMTGGWPYSQQHFFVSGSPVHYYNAQDFAQAELNIRPQWLSGYQDELHFDLLTPSSNPYGGSTWRRFKGHSISTTSRSHLTGTKQTAYPRDDQHAWFYHVEHAYLMSGNKWIKDWYDFMAEFKKISLSERDPYPDRSHRAEGEALAVALASYKYTGSPTLKPFIENYITDVHNKHIKAPHSIRPDPNNNNKIAAYQVGYLLRSFIGMYNEFPENPKTMETIRNYVQWNYRYGQFSYYKSATDTLVSKKTSETSLSLVDSVIWFSLQTQETHYADHAINYVEVGLNNKKPYGRWSSWVGQFEAPMYRYYKQNIK
jgi:hypothetical protein